MSSPTTAQLNAWGAVCATLKAAEPLAPSGANPIKATRVQQHVGAYIDDIANALEMDVGDLRDAIEASAGYTNSGGSGAICS